MKKVRDIKIQTQYDLSQDLNVLGISINIVDCIKNDDGIIVDPIETMYGCIKLDDFKMADPVVLGKLFIRIGNKLKKCAK